MTVSWRPWVGIGVTVGLGAAVLMGQGGVTPGPMGLQTVGVGLTKIGNRAELQHCDPGKPLTPRAGDAGYGCGDVVRLAGLQIGNEDAGVSFEMDPSDYLVVSDLGPPGTTLVRFDLGLSTGDGVQLASGGNLEVAGNTNSTTFGHIYTDAGISANSIASNILSVGGVFSSVLKGVFDVHNLSVTSGRWGVIGTVSVPGAVFGAPCLAGFMAHTGGTLLSGTPLYCMTSNADTVTVSLFCPDNVVCEASGDAGYFEQVFVFVLNP